MRHNKNYRINNGQHVVPMHERRKRELAWALYCAEGYAANLRNCLTWNAFTMAPADLRVVKSMLKDAEKHALGLRALISGDAND